MRTTATVLTFAAVIGCVALVSAQAPVDQPRFEVAAVKRNISDSRVSSTRLPSTGIISIVNAPLRAIIRYAYDVRDYQIIGAPAWIDNERFDITARPPSETPPAQIAAMRRGLLADRFGLHARRETRDQSFYTLIVAGSDGRLGPQIISSTGDCAATISARRAGVRTPREGPIQCGERMGPRDVALGDRPITRLLPILEEHVGRPVFDRTGLTGMFDLSLRWNPQPVSTSATVPADDPPSIFAAIEQQPGLKLESARGPVEVLVIDSVARPTPD